MPRLAHNRCLINIGGMNKWMHSLRVRKPTWLEVPALEETCTLMDPPQWPQGAVSHSWGRCLHDGRLEQSRGGCGGSKLVAGTWVRSEVTVFCPSVSLNPWKLGLKMSWFCTPSPLDVHTLVCYFWASVSALQIGSSVPIFLESTYVH